jgi:hypothetical protein
MIAQEEQREVQTLFGNKSGFGGYLGLNTKLGDVNGQEAFFTGGEVAFVLNRSFNLGVEGYGMVNHVLSDEVTDTREKLYIQMGYGGLHLEPVINSEGLIHITMPILLGAGGIGQSIRPFYEEHEGEVTIDFDHEFHDSDYFFVAEPGIGLELNLFKFMRVAGGASYRFTTDIDIGGMDSKDINGWNANLSLRIGWF